MPQNLFNVPNSLKIHDLNLQYSSTQSELFSLNPFELSLHSEIQKLTLIGNLHPGNIGFSHPLLSQKSGVTLLSEMKIVNEYFIEMKDPVESITELHYVKLYDINTTARQAKLNSLKFDSFEFLNHDPKTDIYPPNIP